MEGADAGTAAQNPTVDHVATLVPVGWERLSDQITSHLRDSFLLAIGVVKGVVLAQAAVTAVAIWQATASAHVYALTAAQVTVGMFGTVLTYSAKIFGAKLLPPGPDKIWDHFLPLFIAFAEFAMFATVS